MPGQSRSLLARWEASYAGISAWLAKIRQTNHRYKLVAGRSHISKISGKRNLIRRLSNGHGVEQRVGGRIENIDNIGPRIHHETKAAIGCKPNGSQARAHFDPIQNLMSLRVDNNAITVTSSYHVDRFAERRGRYRRRQRSEFQYFDPGQPRRVNYGQRAAPFVCDEGVTIVFAEGDLMWTRAGHNMSGDFRRTGVYDRDSVAGLIRVFIVHPQIFS